MAGETKNFGDIGPYDELAQRIWNAHLAGEPLMMAAGDYYEAFLENHPGPELDKALELAWPGPGPMPIGAEVQVLVVRSETAVLG